MTEALTALGVGIEPVAGESEFGDDLRITPGPLAGATVDCGQAGTVMRFIAPLAGLAEGEVLVTAHENALHRPMGAMIQALRDLGVDVDDEGRWALPFRVLGRGQIRGRRTRDRCVVLEPVRLRPAARGPALRRRTAPAPHGRAAAERAAHRDDDRGPRPPRRAGGAARSRGVDRPPDRPAREGRARRARPVERGTVPRRGAAHGRRGDDHRLAPALHPAGRPAQRPPHPVRGRAPTGAAAR